MPWVLDGNNLARGGDREAVRRAALGLVRREHARLIVFFDGPPPPGSPAVEHLGSVEVRYVPNADRAILEFLAGSSRSIRVATDDRELARRARAVGAETVDREQFWERVHQASVTFRDSERREPRPGLIPGYSEGVERLADRPLRIPRRRSLPRRWR